MAEAIPGSSLSDGSTFTRSAPATALVDGDNGMGHLVVARTAETAIELARECGVDINYLNVIFFKETGMTLYKYLMGVRMEHAKYLLEENRLSVSEIASGIGYPNANSFTRAFRKYASQAPTAYRHKQEKTHHPAATT